MGWWAFFLECSFDDHANFEDTMEVCSNFTSMAEVHKEDGVVVKKATMKELKTLIPHQLKGAISVDILRWAVKQANSDDALQRAKWAKHREYKRLNDHHVAIY
ncbi:Chitinase domain-containing protein 1 [Hordeum vulgare]|nr:Chitinase domain-containing protein 1 [Hordeum vulgare]